MSTTAQDIANQLAQGRSLGAVPGANPQDVNSTLKQFGVITVTVKAGQTFPTNVAGRFVYVYTQTTNPVPGFGVYPVILKTDTGDAFLADESGKGYVFDRPFSNLQIANTLPDPAGNLPIDVTLVLYIGFGDIRRNTPGAGIGGGVVVTNVNLQLHNFFNRPTDGGKVYVANQVVSNFTAGTGANWQTFQPQAVFDNTNGRIIITRARLAKNQNTTANASFRLYLFMGVDLNQKNYVDGNAFAMNSGDINNTQWQTMIDFPSCDNGGGAGDSAVSDISGLNIPMQFRASGVNNTPNSKVIGQLVATAAYSAASNERFTLDLWIDRN